MTNDAPHGNPHNPTEEHPTGPNLTVGQVPDEHTYQSVYSRTDAEQADPEPDPVEVWKRFWRFIIDPKHTSAVAAIATLALCVTTILYTVFSALQWSAGSEAAGAAKSSADTAIKTMRIDQRAWVGGGPASALIELKEKQPIVITVMLKNTGKTPAFVTGGYVASRPLDISKDLPPQSWPGPQADIEHNVMFPSGEQLVPSQIDINGKAMQFTKQMADGCKTLRYPNYRKR